MVPRKKSVVRSKAGGEQGQRKGSRTCFGDGDAHATVTHAS